MSKSNRTLWQFFPIAGLRIEPTPDDLGTVLFDRSTVLAPEEIVAFARHMPFARKTDQDADDWETITMSSKLQKADSFLAVKSSGLAGRKAQEENAVRAYQVMGALSLISLCYLDFAHAWYLYDQWHGAQAQHILSINEGFGWAGSREGYLGRDYRIDDPPSPIRLTRSQLVGALSQGPFSGLTDIVLGNCPHVSNGIRKRVRNAAMFLYESAHTPTPESQIIGAVTAMEVLLRPEHTDFRLVENRVRSLLGSTLADHYAIEAVIRYRNAITHDGDRGSWGKAKNAVVLAVTVLLQAATTMLRFASYGDFQNHLDQHIAQRNLGKPADQSPLVDPTPDYLSFKIVCYLFRRARNGNGATVPALDFAASVLLLSEIRGMPLAEALDVMSYSILDLRSPFENEADLQGYVESNGESVHNRLRKLQKDIKADRLGQWRQIPGIFPST